MTVAQYQTQQQTSDTEPAGGVTEASTVATAVYVCFLISYVLGGVPALLGLVIAYVAKGQSRDARISAHYSFQISTFWWGLLWVVIGSITTFFFVGYLIIFAWFCWSFYRSIKGLVSLNNGTAPR